MAGTEPFDRTQRRLRRDRAQQLWADHAFWHDRIVTELLERLAGVQREFTNALILGFGGEDVGHQLAARGICCIAADPGWKFAAAQCGVQCDEDRLPFRDSAFDLVLSPGLFDTTNDLPGALSLIRRCLKPDGLLLAGFVGGGSLPRLRAALLAADMAGNAASARIHPQIDLRSAGDLLMRAGFALPVADGETLRVRYADLAALVADLRGAAGTSLIGGRMLSRRDLRIAQSAFAAERDDEKTTETIEIIYLTAWAPSPDQPRPAKRGSGKVSLAETLAKR